MKRFSLALLVFLMTAGAAVAGDAPPVSEYDTVPRGMLLRPDQRSVAPVETAVDAPAIDPQVPTHSLTDITGDTAAPVAAALQSMAQIEAAYAAGRYAEVAGPLEMLVAQGDPNAMLMLGVMLETGQGMPANPTRAAALMTRAAESNIAVAQHRLAIMYYQGKGLAKDDVRAMMWLHIAIAKYPPGAARDRAVSDRSNLDAEMPRRDRETALFMAREWLQKRGELHLLDAGVPAP